MTRTEEEQTKERPGEAQNQLVGAVPETDQRHRQPERDTPDEGFKVLYG